MSKIRSVGEDIKGGIYCAADEKYEEKGEYFIRTQKPAVQ